MAICIVKFDLGVYCKLRSFPRGQFRICVGVTPSKYIEAAALIGENTGLVYKKLYVIYYMYKEIKGESYLC